MNDPLLERHLQFSGRLKSARADLSIGRVAITLDVPLTAVLGLRTTMMLMIADAIPLDITIDVIQMDLFSQPPDPTP